MPRVNYRDKRERPLPAHATEIVSERTGRSKVFGWRDAITGAEKRSLSLSPRKMHYRKDNEWLDFDPAWVQQGNVWVSTGTAYRVEVPAVAGRAGQYTYISETGIRVDVVMGTAIPARARPVADADKQVLWLRGVATDTDLRLTLWDEEIAAYWVVYSEAGMRVFDSVVTMDEGDGAVIKVPNKKGLDNLNRSKDHDPKFFREFKKELAIDYTSEVDPISPRGKVVTRTRGVWKEDASGKPLVKIVNRRSQLESYSNKVIWPVEVFV